MIRWIRKVAVYLLIGIVSCIEPIEPSNLGFDDLLVVEALITDQAVHQEVVLNRTFAIDEEQADPEVGANVWLTDQDNQRVDFYEASDGRYLTVNPYGASVGGTLILHIETADGRAYESAEVLVEATLPIDSLYVVFTPEPVNSNLFGGRFSFFVDAQDNSVGNEYLRWRWNRTFEFSTGTPSRWLFENGEFIIRERGSPNDSLQVEVCWSTLENQNINIQQLLVPNESITRFPIYEFHSEEGYMKKGFSIEAKVYALSEFSFAYWNSIKETSEDQGSLADTQPGSIIGNMRSLTNPTETVLGIFEASQEHSVRRQYDRLDFLDEGFKVIRANFIQCREAPLSSSDEVHAVDSMLSIYGVDWTLAYFGDETAFYLPKYCSECTAIGTNQQPSFWEERVEESPDL